MLTHTMIITTLGILGLMAYSAAPFFIERSMGAKLCKTLLGLIDGALIGIITVLVLHILWHTGFEPIQTLIRQHSETNWQAELKMTLQAAVVTLPIVGIAISALGFLASPVYLVLSSLMNISNTGVRMLVGVVGSLGVMLPIALFLGSITPYAWVALSVIGSYLFMIQQVERRKSQDWRKKYA